MEDGVILLFEGERMIGTLSGRYCSRPSGKRREIRNHETRKTDQTKIIDCLTEGKGIDTAFFKGNRYSGSETDGIWVDV